MGGLVRARCAVVQRVRLAGDRAVERGCRGGAMGQRGGENFSRTAFLKFEIISVGTIL